MSARVPGIPLAAAGVTALAVVAGWTISRDPGLACVVAAGLLCAAALLRPSWGLLGYIILASILPSSEGVTVAELAVFGLLAWLLLIATARLLHRPPRDRLRLALIRSVCLGLVVLGLLGLVSWRNGISPRDWARDVVPLGNLTLIVLVPTFLRHPRDVRLVRSLFLCLVGFLGLQSAAALSSQLGQRLGFASPLRVGSTWVLPLLVAAGLAALSEFPRPRLRYILLGVVGLGCAALTPTRTAWLGVLVVAVVSIVFNLCSGGRAAARNVLLVVFLLLNCGALLLVWRSSGNPQAWLAQQERFATLGALQEDQSVQIRREQFREAMQGFAHHPFVGVGLGYQYLYTIEETDKYAESTNYNHCDPANLLCKTGLIGTAALYTVFILAIALGSRVRRETPLAEDRWYASVVRTSTIAALIAGLSCPVLQERGATFLLGLMIGILAAGAGTKGAAAPATECEAAWRPEAAGSLPS